MLVAKSVSLIYIMERSPIDMSLPTNGSLVTTSLVPSSRQVL